ncbi:MAG TPA: (d)CMP kinase [Eubacteriaceae bacterium]|jgi:cytidylate kinase|nr:(d)CMP kinase [Eubacteriaceae bacterium]
MIIQIAIDGPAGAGKSTIAKLLAENLGITYLDTGAMYRALTWKVLKEAIDLNDEKLIISTAKNITIEINQKSVFIDNQDITEAIREPIISQNVSQVAQIAEVREIMVKLQRKIGEEKSIVMDGRDIGTHVLPDANYKFFLTATVDERARRRALELNLKGFPSDIEEIKKEIIRRDNIDTTRKASPLKPAADAKIIDTTNLTIDEIIDQLINIISKGE